MNADTTYVQIVLDTVSNPAVIQWIAGIIVSALTFIFGLTRIPKGIAAKIVRFGAIIVIAIIETEQRSNIQVARGYPAPPSDRKLDMATDMVMVAIEKAPEKSFFTKTMKTLGGVANVVNVAFPLVQPFLKKGK